VSAISTESMSKRRPSSSPNVSSPPEVNTDSVRGAAQPEVVSNYDGFMGQSSSTGQPCRGSLRTSGNHGDASSVTEPAVTSGASSPDAVPAEPEVEYRGAGSRGPVRSRPRGSSSFVATQQPPATVSYSSEQVPAALRSSEMTRTAGMCTDPGGAADYSALPGLSSLQRAPGSLQMAPNVGRRHEENKLLPVTSESSESPYVADQVPDSRPSTEVYFNLDRAEVRQRNSAEYELPTGRDDDELLAGFSKLSTVELRPSLCVSDLHETPQREQPTAGPTAATLR